MTTLYEALGMNRDNSIFKSVFITNNTTMKGLPIVEVEAYDDTFLNAIRCPSMYDKTVDRIIKAVYSYFNCDVWLIVATDRYGHIELLLSEYYMRDVFKLI